MYFLNNSTFPLTNLPYIIQTRFMECLPYFAQIALAQTNLQFLKIYESRCKKGNITDSVNIIVDKNGIYINDEFILFKNEVTIKQFIQGNHFPTQFLIISNTEDVKGFNIGILAKELTKNGLYFQNKNQQKEVAEWMKKYLNRKEYLQIEIGWERIRKSLSMDDSTDENDLCCRNKRKNGSSFTNLSYFLERE